RYGCLELIQIASLHQAVKPQAIIHAFEIRKLYGPRAVALPIHLDYWAVHCEIERERYELHPLRPFYTKRFLVYANTQPLVLVKILERILRVQLFFIDIADIWLVPGRRPRNPVVEPVEEKR